MGFSNFRLIILLLIGVVKCQSTLSQCSKYDYEDRLLRKMIRMESNMERMFNESKDTVAELRDEMAKIKTEKETMQAKMDMYGHNQTAALAGLERFRTNLNERIKDFREATEARLAAIQTTPNVLFRAHNPMDTAPSNGQTFIFQSVMVNIGDGYDRGTGIFTAPYDGTYVFSAQICTYTNVAVQYAIVKENSYIMAGYYLEKDSTQCTTAMALTNLKTGENVWIKSTQSHSSTALTESTNYWTSFSGSLIRADAK